jgi:hypothetical protein
MPKITGSVYAGQPAKNFLKDNLKVSFPQASEIAAKQIANGTVVEGQLGIVQGYVAYAFFVGGYGDPPSLSMIIVSYY